MAVAFCLIFNIKMNSKFSALLLAGALAATAGCNETKNAATGDDDYVPADTTTTVMTLTNDSDLVADRPLNEVRGNVAMIITHGPNGTDTIRLDEMGYCVGPILELADNLFEAKPSWAAFAKKGVTTYPDTLNTMTVERDLRGLITGFKVGDIIEYSYSWDGDRLTGYEISDRSGSMPHSEKGIYKYGEDGLATEYTAVLTMGATNHEPYTEVYSEYKLDSLGNWVGRTATVGKQAFAITREIIYR